VETYGFLNTIVLVNGVEIINYSEGDDVIQAARRNPSAIDVVGADGVMTVSFSADLTGKFILKLQQSSSSNAYLSGLVAAGESGVFIPIFVQFKDPTTGDLVSSTNGYISKPADLVRGSGINSQEWEIVVERMDILYKLAA
jgi:Bacteriophage KPP10, Structural protein ORF10